MTKEICFRTKKIVRTSILGIVANFLLSAFKALVGVFSHSIAIVLDAVNNLSDALSSIITIIGTKVAGKRPDKEHPFGHGRSEYLSTLIIAFIILFAGFNAMGEAIDKIIHPQLPDYSKLGIIIIVVAVFVKIGLGFYFRKVGKSVNSTSLVVSGNDALLDSLISLATLVSAFIFIVFNVSTEAYLAVFISLVIIKAGIDMLRVSFSQILGERVEKNFANEVKNTVAGFDNVLGVYDLVLDNYGVDVYMGSVHIEVESTKTAQEIDDLTRKIMREVYVKHKVILTAVGIYSLNTTDSEVISIREDISKIVYSFDGVIQMHAFYLCKADKTINFDIILDFANENRNQIYESILKAVQEKYSDYAIFITMDVDVF